MQYHFPDTKRKWTEVGWRRRVQYIEGIEPVNVLQERLRSTDPEHWHQIGTFQHDNFMCLSIEKWDFFYLMQEVEDRSLGERLDDNKSINENPSNQLLSCDGYSHQDFYWIQIQQPYE